MNEGRPGGRSVGLEARQARHVDYSFMDTKADMGVTL